MAPKKRDDNEARLEVLARFKKFDLNNDGKISLQELSRVLQFLDLKSWPDHKVAQLFYEMDKDANNKVDKDEFVNFVFGKGRQPKAFNKSLADLPEWDAHLQAEAQAKQRLVDEQRERLSSTDAAVRLNEFEKAIERLACLSLGDLQCASAMADKNGKFRDARVGAVAEACCVLTGLPTAQIRGSTQGEGNFEGCSRLLSAAGNLNVTKLSASTLAEAAAVLMSQKKKGKKHNDEEEPPGLSLLFEIDDAAKSEASKWDDNEPWLVWQAFARWACAVVAVALQPAEVLNIEVIPAGDKMNIAVKRLSGETDVTFSLASDATVADLNQHIGRPARLVIGAQEVPVNAEEDALLQTILEDAGRL